MKLPVYIKLLCGLAFVVLLQQSCKPDENYPPAPDLVLEGFSKIKRENGKDSIVTLHLTFKDGDGDIGLTSADSLPPFNYGQRYYYNLFVEFYSIENGVARKITSPFITLDTLYKDTVNYSQRIGNLTPEGKNKAIKGRIDVLTPFFNIDLSATRPDSVYYEIRLFDRALNGSPLVKTSLILLDL